MIAPTGAAVAFDLGRRAQASAAARVLALALGLEPLRAARPAPRPQPRRLAAALDGLLTDGAPVRPLAPARAAAAAFRAGDGFLPGQMIDRSI